MTQGSDHELQARLRAQLHRFRDVVSLLPLLRAPQPWRIRTLAPTAPTSFTLTTKDGLRLAASYHRLDATRRPGVVLLHGGSRRGQHQPLMLVLAELLKPRGYHILSYDARCYGRSDPPASATDASAFDFTLDVQAALDWLSDQPEVDATRLYVLGHSFGAGTALATDACDPRISRLVLFGPPRRLAERFLDDGAPDRQRILARLQYDMNVPYPLNPDVIQQMWRRHDIAAHAARFAQESHTPLLLIDTQHESDADRTFLRQLRAGMNHRVMYWTVPRTDHYLNTGRLLGRVIYHPACVLPFVERVDAFFRRDFNAL